MCESVLVEMLLYKYSKRANVWKGRKGKGCSLWLYMCKWMNSEWTLYVSPGKRKFSLLRELQSGLRVCQVWQQTGKVVLFTSNMSKGCKQFGRRVLRASALEMSIRHYSFLCFFLCDWRNLWVLVNGEEKWKEFFFWIFFDFFDIFMFNFRLKVAW